MIRGVNIKAVLISATVAMIIGFASMANSWASIPSKIPNGEGVMIKTSLLFQNKAKSIDIKAEDEFFISSAEEDWMPLIRPREGVLLVGKVEKTGKRSVQIKYKLLDSNSKEIVLAEPIVQTQFGALGKVKVENNQNQIQIVSIVTEAKDGTGAKAEQ
jgi:hypothetical protein